MPEQGKIKNASEVVEYILVTDKDSKVILTTTSREEAKVMAKTIRKAGGEVTVFRSLSL